MSVKQFEDRITPSGPTITTLASFDGTNGAGPEGGLTMDSSGNLYGSAFGSALFNVQNYVFEWNQTSGAISDLASYASSEGIPVEPLTLDSNGDLYGATKVNQGQGGGGPLTGPGGIVFEWVNGQNTVTTLGPFNADSTPTSSAGLVMDKSGNLYGTATPFAIIGGNTYYGSVFEVAQNSGTITTLFSFNGTDGDEPRGGLIMDSSGNLFGTTEAGGSHGDGTVFELQNTPAGYTINTLISFDGTDGEKPVAGLVTDGNGNLYGTAMLAGASGGEVFELANNGGGNYSFSTLASFSSGPLPENVNTRLVMDSTGDLFGGGDNGTLFELVHGQNTITTLATFDGGAKGEHGSGAEDGLVMDRSGNLYGATSDGGTDGLGTVFELAGVGSAPLTDQWTGANFATDTNWSDGANWSTGSPPSATQTAIFTDDTSVKSFTSTIDPGFTSPIAGLDIDNTWGGTLSVNSSLFITGNLTFASGTFGGSGAVTIAGPASVWSGGTINLGAGGMTNSGTLTVDTTAGNLGLTSNGTLTNNGTLIEAGTHSLLLENGAALSNAAGAIFDLTNNGSIGQSGGGTLTNAGTLEKTGGTGTSTVSSSFVNSKAITVQIGTLDLASAGGTNTGGMFTVSKGATLDLTGGTTVTYTGTYTGTGAGTVALSSGTLQVGTGGASFDMSGNLFHWTGGTVDVTAGNFTNTGTINYSGSKGIVLNGAGTLLNDKAIIQTSTGTLMLDNGAVLDNAKGASYNLKSNGGINQSNGGTIINAGTLERTAGTGTSTIASSTLANTGTVAVSSGILDIAATVAQVSGSSLTAGTWTVTTHSSSPATLEITSAGSLATLSAPAKVTLSGVTATFTNLTGLTTIAKGDSLSLLAGQLLSTAGALTNNGGLTLGPGTILTVGGNFTQSSSGSLTIQLGGTSSAPTFGQVVSTTGTVTVAGSLHVTSIVEPAVSSAFELLDNGAGAAINGVFAALAQGASFTVKDGAITMSFEISYSGNDADGGNNIIITRVL